jgi:hypothetical protein
LDANDMSASCLHISYCAWTPPQKWRKCSSSPRLTINEMAWYAIWLATISYDAGVFNHSVAGASQAFKPLFSLLRKQGEPYGSASANDRSRRRCKAEWMKRYLRQSDTWRFVALAKRNEKLIFRTSVTWLTPFPLTTFLLIMATSLCSLITQVFLTYENAL